LAMVISIAQIVVLPIIAGLLSNRFLPQVSRALFVHLPNIASTLILLIIGIVVAVNANDLADVGFAVVIAVILHNTLGLLIAYSLAKLSGQTEVIARTIALEVGMQNSGLGVALAFKFFGPASAIPGALFSIWHNISASVLASFWKWQTERKIRELRK
ncbi:MAG TPA: bile acid:sodium symporter, partial [Pseudomonadales bacterium]|nr:bile acid:sodium symporter [Pseudomonadales bacterium]